MIHITFEKNFIFVMKKQNCIQLTILKCSTDLGNDYIEDVAFGLSVYAFSVVIIHFLY